MARNTARRQVLVTSVFIVAAIIGEMYIDIPWRRAVLPASLALSMIPWTAALMIALGLVPDVTEEE